MKKAFTLAEVLITLVIIGVVAALTIPNLMQKYQEQATVKKVQKFYSNVYDAYKLAVKDNGTPSEWGLTGDNQKSAKKIYEILFKPYFKIAKDCGINNTGNCIPNTMYKTIKNNDFNNYAINPSYYKIKLEDGSSVWFRGSIDQHYDMVIFYDVNGTKEPNQWSRDLFELNAKNDKVWPVGIPSNISLSPNSFNTHCQVTGQHCTAWVIYKGNMDYLHCNGLTWNSRSCKDK